MRLRLLNIDRSVTDQDWAAAACAEGSAHSIDATAGEAALRLWATRRKMRWLAQLLEHAPAPANGPTVTFYGSGDYHHVATALIGEAVRPVAVIHFDNHPDWVSFPATHNCGGWVNRALELPQVQRIVTLGICSEDLALPQLKTGNVRALGAGRLEIHPWRASPSRVWGAIGDGPGHRRVGNHLVWDCLEHKDWPAFMDSLLARLPTEAVWITIDKDVLRPEDAATNWDQGQLPLDKLLAALDQIAARKSVEGVDVCGEFSPPRFGDPIKRLAAWLDHPRALPSADAALELNSRTNRRLVEMLSRVLP